MNNQLYLCKHPVFDLPEDNEGKDYIMGRCRLCGYEKKHVAIHKALILMNERWLRQDVSPTAAYRKKNFTNTFR